MRLPITKPYFGTEEFELITKPLETGWVVQGPYVKEFERLICDYTGAKYAVALNSCTSGQFIMSRILGLKEDDEVIVPAFTWISTANSVEYTGAKVVFCDINLETFSLDVTQIEKKITAKTKAIYPVNLFGLPANLEKIKDIAKKYNLKIVEDCACGLMGRINGKHCGLFGKAGILSFHPRKSITTGEGGMIITDDEKIYKRASALKEHGSVKTDLERHNQKGGFLLAEYNELGYNYRMTDIQGALGVAQARKINEIFKLKQELAQEFNRLLEEIDWLDAPMVPEDYTHGYQAYVTLFKADEAKELVLKGDMAGIDKLSEERDKIMQTLEDLNIATRQGTHAVHIQNYYSRKYGYQNADFPASYAADKLTIALPFYPAMTKEEINYLFENLKNIRV